MPSLNKKNFQHTDYLQDTYIRKKRAIKSFNTCTLILLAVILISLLICFEKPYNLESPAVYGPALCFLNLLAWPIVFLPGMISRVAGCHNSKIMFYLLETNPALTLAMLALLLLGIIWLLFRRYGIKWLGANGLNIAGHFVIIFACWGILQLLICAVIFLQDTNTLVPFHKDHSAVVELQKKQ